ncbi:unnamed protein product [Paramecium sonneborni]|uniref:Uncharacterized protein n=1 Tax=Paramecium sonneborni TaxID=65129 RepID=A0A8S1R584_9CILI|nr:unnamed protein product [Paramecium sonneborni]
MMNQFKLRLKSYHKFESLFKLNRYLIQRNHVLKIQIPDWQLKKQTFIKQFQEVYENCQIILLNQELIGFALILIKGYSFQLMIKQDDLNSFEHKNQLLHQISPIKGFN